MLKCLTRCSTRQTMQLCFEAEQWNLPKDKRTSSSLPRTCLLFSCRCTEVVKYVQNTVTSFSFPWFPKSTCWALHSVSNNLCDRCLGGVPIYIRQRFSNCIPGNRRDGKKIGWGSNTAFNTREQSFLHIPGTDPNSSAVQSTPVSMSTAYNEHT